MKRLFVVLLCFVACLGAMSQVQTTKVVKGAVIDKYGNPLPGAMVMATGGAESTYVDADGTFSMEVPVWLKSLTVKYAGMSDKRKKIKTEELLIFEMKGRITWFVNAVASVIVVDEGYMRAGIMCGTLANWGWYCKFMPSFDEATDGIPAVTLGVTKQIKERLHLYAGLGYAPVRYEEDVYYWWEEDVDFDNGVILDLGLITRFSAFSLNLGVSVSTDLDEEFEVEPHLGIGFNF